ncbi:Isopentenyl phosphate kinase [Rhynchospora pubera]|uniref:Isopentenyl phosphate kinase n=1 Tax=Rhynchospora pubera TaxID=906938 RepID=A0AAV8HEX2_9POAL|nr:Isopentenyl phosphate kinase [Rhynchospora pubera]
MEAVQPKSDPNPNPLGTPPPAPVGARSLQTPLRCIIKLGGAAITNKYELESINKANLSSVCEQLREAMMPQSEKGIGMDWSRRDGNEIELGDISKIGESSVRNGLNSNFIVVHGAGSFGHFQASKSGVHKGGLHSPLVQAGFVATRISVTSLNLAIVRALARGGIPAVGMPPFACGWSTRQRDIASADASQIMDSLLAGFVPILHGDAVLDHALDCTILSGDVIIRHLAELFTPKYVIFLTDVHGVYDRPPSDPDAVLLKEIVVKEDGSWTVVKPDLLQAEKGVEITVAAHDTTGGMEAKISEAAIIAKLGIDVYITKVGTEYSLRALKGQVHENPDDWLGTIIRSDK